MVEILLNICWEWVKRSRLYGKTLLYYGAVSNREIDLHLHMLLWIMDSYPQEIRDQIMDQIRFSRKNGGILKSVHVGNLYRTIDEVKEQVHENMKAEEYQDPYRLFLIHLQNLRLDCEKCESVKYTNWWEIKNTVDDLILRSNVHQCRLQSQQ